jgi:hypothetical protein
MAFDSRTIIINYFLKVKKKEVCGLEKKYLTGFPSGLFEIDYQQ